MKFYILDELGNVRVTEDFIAHACSLGTHVAEEVVAPGVKVSTIFLGIDAVAEPGETMPNVWETMVFCCHCAPTVLQGFDRYIVRCGGTKEQAEAMHEEVKGNIQDAWISAAVESITKVTL